MPNGKIDFKNVIEHLKEEQAKWKTSGDRHHRTLYKLLGDCLEGVLKAEAEPTGFLEAVKSYGVKTIRGSRLESVVAKLVFADEDRRQASKYGQVLRLARQENKTPEEFPDWLTKRGGIEGIKTGRGDAAAKRQEEVNKGRVFLRAREGLGTFRYSAMPLPSDLFLMVGKSIKPNEVTVVAIVDDNKLADQAVIRVVREQSIELKVRLQKKKYSRSELEAELERIAREQGIEIEE